MAAKAFNVLNAIGGFFASTKIGATNIDSIRAMVDGGHAHLAVLGRREQFYLLRFHAAKVQFFGTITSFLVFLQV
jgi:hypothetical protein